MKNFTKVVKEVQTTLNKLVLFDTAINAILVFLTLFFIFSFFELSVLYPLMLALAYFGFVAFRRVRVNKIRLVEKTYRSMDEKLRTAAEYINTEENPVIQELQAEVVNDLKKVEESAFLNQRRIYVKSIAIIALCFLILLLSPVNFALLPFQFNTPPQEDSDLGDGPGIANSGESKIRYVIGPKDSPLKKLSEDIYEKSLVAPIGTEELELTLKTTGVKMDIKNIQDPQQLNFSDSSYPEEVRAVAAGAYEESIPAEDVELVKDYFNQLAKN